jgi:hypothetical protein
VGGFGAAARFATMDFQGRTRRCTAHLGPVGIWASSAAKQMRCGVNHLDIQLKKARRSHDAQQLHGRVPLFRSLKVHQSAAAGFAITASAIYHAGIGQNTTSNLCKVSLSIRAHDDIKSCPHLGRVCSRGARARQSSPVGHSCMARHRDSYLIVPPKESV